MPCDYSHYPANWNTEIRPAILAREKNRCKFCRIPNGVICATDIHGVRHQFTDMGFCDYDYPKGARTFPIVLTVAHLDHDITNNSEDNLAALCQKCHLTHDAGQHAANARATRESGQGMLALEYGPSGRDTGKEDMQCALKR